MQSGVLKLLVKSTLTSTVYRLYILWHYVVLTKDYKLNKLKDRNKHKFEFSPGGQTDHI